MLCFRLFSENNPAAPLAEAVAMLREGQAPKDLYAVEPASFQQIPNAPFAYWVSERIRRLFVELPAFEGEGRTVRQGLATANDFRFVRNFWEVGTESEGDINRRWHPFVKGGSYSPYYSDISLLVNWMKNGNECKSYIVQQYPYLNGNAEFVAKNPTYYFKKGLVFPRRTRRFCPKLLPAGVVFSNAGQVAFAEGRELPIAALFSSLANQTLVFCSLGTNPQDAGGTNPQFEVGVIQRSPVILSTSMDDRLAHGAKQAWSSKRRSDTSTLTSHAFHAPALAPSRFIKVSDLS